MKTTDPEHRQMSLKRPGMAHLAAGLLIVLCAAACAGPNKIAREAHRVPYRELGGAQSRTHVETMSHPPYVIEVKRGDEVPIRLALESRLAKLEAPTMKLRAERDFWILIRKKGRPLLSEDGKNFGEKSKNSFAVGLGVTKDGPSVAVKIGYRQD